MNGMTLCMHSEDDQIYHIFEHIFYTTMQLRMSRRLRKISCARENDQKNANPVPAGADVDASKLKEGGLDGAGVAKGSDAFDAGAGVVNPNGSLALGAGAGVVNPNGSLALGAGAGVVNPNGSLDGVVPKPNGSLAAGAGAVFWGPFKAGGAFLRASIVLLALSSHRFISSITVDSARMRGQIHYERMDVV